MSTAVERMIASMLGGANADAMVALDSAVTSATAANPAIIFKTTATVTRIRRDAKGNPETQLVNEENVPIEDVVYQGPANLIKPSKTKLVTQGGGKEDVGDWIGQTTDDYNPEAGDTFICRGFTHHVKGSTEGATDTAILSVYLIRVGRYNRGV